MAMELYSHNRTAYEKAVAMLASTGKAAVIHPMGTGKSFIGFKLCEDHPDETVLWLSPSEYIFRTQLENWSDAGGEELSNIVFLTYAKLMQMDETEISELHPSYIIYDEYHLQKELYSRGELRDDRTERLLALGLDLKTEDAWETKFRLTKEYSESHGGSLKVPADLIIDGVWLNKWINEQRLAGEGKRKKKLTEDQRRRLESIGMVFRT